MIDYADAPKFGRIDGIKKALEALHKINKDGVRIVETGTTRGNLGGGIKGDGWATLAFAWYCKKYGGEVHTIDVNSQAIDNCKSITKEYEKFIHYHLSDSALFLKDFKKTIHLLYLDSADDPKVSLAECSACYSKLRENAVILIDDSSVKKKRKASKGSLTYKFLHEKGWDLVFDDGNQIMMLRGEHGYTPL